MSLYSLLSDKRYQFRIFLFVLVSLSILATFLYGNQLFGGDDYYFHNARFEALMQSLKDGTFPSYIDYTGMYGYGYLIKPFYSDFILIPYAALGNVTSKEFAYIFLLFSMTILCGIFMYITVNKVYKSSYAAAISALLYTFALYRLLDVYHRAALGEALSFTFLPIVFLGLHYIVKGDYRKWYIITIGFSLMILTHVLSSVLLFITVIIILLISYKDLLKEPKRIYYLILAGFVTFIIAGYYIFPFLEQIFSNTFYFQKFKTSPYIFSLSRLSIPEIFRDMADGFSLIKGGSKTGLLLVLPVLLRFFIKKTDKTKYLKSVDIGVIIGLLYILMTSTLIPWDRIPLAYMSFIQFTWRLYEFVCYFFAVAGGYYLYLLCKSNKSKIIAFSSLVILTSLVIIIDAKNYKEMKLPARSDKNLNEENHYVKAGMEYVPARTPLPDPFVLERKDSVLYQQNETVISDFKRNKNIVEFTVTTHQPDSLELPLIYYKGYSASLDGKDIPVTQSSHGLVQVPVDQSGRVEACYKGTLIQKLSFCTTILSIFALCGYIFVQNRKRKHLK